MRHVSTLIPVGLIVVLVSVFLIGQRLDARWAGGTGRVETCAATDLATGQLVKRGETMSSPTDSYRQYQLCDGTMLYLDTNTQVTLSQYRNTDPAVKTETQLDLIQGRVVVDGVADIQARNAVFSVGGGACEFVHYSWRDELDVTPLAEMACQLKYPPGAPAYYQTTRFNTFTSELVNVNLFEPQSSTAAAFYAWTGLNFEPLR